MGSKQKARQLLAVSEAHTHYSSIVDLALTYFITKAEHEENPRRGPAISRKPS